MAVKATPSGLLSVRHPTSTDDPAESIAALQEAIRAVLEEMFLRQPRLAGKRYAVELVAGSEVETTHDIGEIPNRWAIVDIEGAHTAVYRNPAGTAWTANAFFLTSVGSGTVSAVVEVWREDV